MRIIGFVSQAMIDVGVPAAPLRDWLAARGVDVRVTNARVPWSLYRDLWAWAEVHHADRALGIRVAEAIPFGARELWDYLLRSAATFGEVARRFCELARIFDEALIPTVEQRGEDAWLVAALAPGHTPGFAMSDYGMARLLGTIRDLAAEPLAPSRVHLRRPRPRDTASHDAFFRCPIAYGQAENALVVPAALMERQLPAADAGLHQALLEHSRASLEQTAPAPPRLGARVDQVVRELIASGHDPGQEVVARRLGHSTRSLRRGLADEATSFAGIVQHVRRALSQAYLLDGQRTDDVAARLGYASAEAFLRAFRRWTGTGPRAWLDAQRGS